MSGIKGYPAQEKLLSSSGNKLFETKSEFVTVQPTDKDRRGLDTVVRFLFRTTPAPLVIEAGSTDRQINITNHGAMLGDVFRMEEGADAYIEAPITAIIDANSFVLGVKLSTAPTVGDEFYILRYVTQRTDETGSQITTVNSGPVQFVLDGVDTEVEEDTVTPGNSIPLPVKIMDAAGLLVDFATEAKQDVQITEAQTANGHLAQIETDSTASAASLAVIEAIDFATETTQVAGNAILTTIETDLDAANATLTSIDGKVLTDTQLRATPVPVSVSSSALPTGAATEAKQDDQITEAQAANALLTTIDADTGAIATSTASIDTKTPALGQALAAASVPVVLPVAQAAALAQETTLAAASAKLPAALGQTTSAASLAVVPASDYIPPSPAVPASVTVKQASITVGTSAVRLTTDAAAPSATRRVLNFMVDPNSTAGFWYGSSGVTSSNGIPAFPGQNLKFDNDPNDYYIISDAAAQSVRILEAE